jgi:tape measure domain-containing protein
MSQRLHGAGVAGQDVMQILKDVGNVAAATGDLGAERLEGISTALSQIISKGKLSAEEMEQLAERGIPAWKLLSESMGLSVGVLRKMGEEGKLTANDLTTALSKVANGKFGDAMKKQAETGMGAFVGLQNAIMVSASVAFEPFYKEIAKFGQQMLRDVQDQQGDFEKIGEQIARYIGKGAGTALLETGKFLGDLLATELLNAFGEKVEKSFAAKFFESFERGFDENFWQPILGKEWFEQEWGKQSETVRYATEQLYTPKAQQNAQNYGRQITNVTNATNQLTDAQRRARQQQEALQSMFTSMAYRLQFFGLETVEAATKVELLNAGITNFMEGQGARVLGLARMLDQKTAESQYNENLESARKTIQGIKEDAEFQLNFINPTALDLFNRQVKQGAFNFKELGISVDSARLAVARLTQAERYRNTQALVDAFTSQPRDTSAQGESARAFADIGKSLGVENLKMGSVSSDAFGQRIAEMVKDSSDFYTLARSLEEFMSNWASADTLQPLITDFDSFAKALKAVATTIEQRQLSEGLKEFDDILGDLGIRIGDRGFQTNLEKFTAKLADPLVAKALEEQAAALGITVANLRELLRLQYQEQQKPTTRKRFADDPNKKPQGDFLTGLLGDGEINGVKTRADAIKDVYRDLGETVRDTMVGMVQAGGQLLESYIMTGEAGAEAFKQLAASIISGIAVEAGIKAIFQVAEGFAALATYQPVKAANHFAAAKVYGVVAGVAAGVGIGIGAAGGLSSGKKEDQSAAPDYQTSNFSNVQSSQNFGTGSNTATVQLAAAVNGLNQRINSMSPGDVLTTGAQQKRGFIASTAVNEMKTSPSNRRGMNQVLGAR